MQNANSHERTRKSKFAKNLHAALKNNPLLIEWNEKELRKIDVDNFIIKVPIFSIMKMWNLFIKSCTNVVFMNATKSKAQKNHLTRNSTSMEQHKHY